MQSFSEKIALKALKSSKNKTKRRTLMPQSYCKNRVQLIDGIPSIVDCKLINRY